jgi:UDP-N-acetylmuramoylalanine--D-glutamate ligase
LKTVPKMKLKDFPIYIEDKKIAVLGFGLSNEELLKFLLKYNDNITVFDKASVKDLKDKIKKFEDTDIKFSLGENYLENLSGFDIIFRTPIIRNDVPEIQEEIKKGAILSSEIELFMKLCPAKIFGVTGSDGKTTTTTIIYQILKEYGHGAWLGGNIGIPLINRLENIEKEDMVVLELSSFQLQTMDISPDVSVITNITPNHLDIHKGMDEYIEAKKNIYKFQDENGVLILNLDNDITREIAMENKKAVTFSRLNQMKNGVILKDNCISFKLGESTEKILKTDDIILPGIHNIENYMAAIPAVSRFVDKISIQKVAKTFAGVEHRLEFVKDINGVKFYNDSIGTSPARTIAGLYAFNENIVLISGGYDKKIPYDTMGAPMADNIKTLISMGQTGKKVEKALLDELKKRGETESINIEKAASLEMAVELAYKNAEKGDIVLFSPASASFDMFPNFAIRGKMFKKIVNEMKFL